MSERISIQDASEWLKSGDPLIRWQTMRDILNSPEIEWMRERELASTIGWGKQFVDAIGPDGSWPKGRWTDTVWTLLTLIDCGFPPNNAAVGRAAQLFLDQKSDKYQEFDSQALLKTVDLCHIGFWLRIGAYFAPYHPGLKPLAHAALTAQMADGGWNCRVRNNPQTQHSSFHTTFNILEGLVTAVGSGTVDRSEFLTAETRAVDFALAHRLYRSDRTGEVIREAFLHLTFPSYWHYNVLRGLDYLRLRIPAQDVRLVDAFDWLRSRQSAKGRWPVERRIPGDTLLDMEKFGGDSRWNTLRSLRVLKWHAGHEEVGS